MNSLFNAANKLKTYNVKINDNDIFSDYVLTFDIEYSNNTPVVNGKFVFKDMFDINQTVSWDEAIVSLSYIDLFEESFNKEFRVISVKEETNEKAEKLVEMKLQDTFSYTLQKSFVSKSFYSNPKEALIIYLKELNITDYEFDLTENNEKFYFTIPENQNNLISFLQEFHKFGYCFYQTKNKICLKSVKDLEPKNLPLNDEEDYVDVSANQLKYNLIRDIYSEHHDREKTPKTTRALAYNILTKRMEYSEFNNVDEYSLNDDQTNIQDTIGRRDVYQTHLNFEQHKKEMKESFFKQNSTTIVINGYAKNDINQIYSLRLKGIKSNKESIDKGNVTIGGKYISVKVVDKIFLDFMIQQVVLQRADFTKRIETNA